MVKRTIKEKIENLWATTADEKPQDYDFGGHEWGEDWDIPFEQTDEEQENEEFMPMMNYRYPLPSFNDKEHSDKEIKKALNKAGSMTLIEDLHSGEKYLALTGGGMDLSWDIAQAYVNLGYVPPAHFCRDLPKMAGLTLTTENKEVILACRKTLNVQKRWNERGLEHLDELESYMREEAKKYSRR